MNAYELQYQLENNFAKYFSLEDYLKIKLCDDLYLKAATIVRTVFKNKKDKAGEPYVGHLFRVSNNLNSLVEQVAGLLHDIIEDTEITAEDLKEIEFPDQIIEIVKLVTKPNIDTSHLTKKEKLELYNREIDLIIESGDGYAINLKTADMSDNYDPNRLKSLPVDKQQWFQCKYEKQLIKLKQASKKS